MQIADAYVYSIARGSYERRFQFIGAESGKLVTSQVPPKMAALLGVKTYCFELVIAQKQQRPG